MEGRVHAGPTWSVLASQIYEGTDGGGGDPGRPRMGCYFLVPTTPSPTRPRPHPGRELIAAYSIGGGGFNNPLGRLRTLGLIDYPSTGYAVALDVLFP